MCLFADRPLVEFPDGIEPRLLKRNSIFFKLGDCLTAVDTFQSIRQDIRKGFDRQYIVSR
jgi:hypothetical protein